MAFAPRRTICAGMIRTGCIIGLGAATLLALALPPGKALAQERRFFQVTPGPRSDPPRLDTSLGAGGGGQRLTVMDTAAIARWLCPNGGRPMRGRPGRCDGRGVVRGGGAGPESEVAGWHADLAPPSHRQLACPAGTVPAQARFNPGTVRCVPEELREASAGSPAALPAGAPDASAAPSAPAQPSAAQAGTAPPVAAAPPAAMAALPATPAAPAPLPTAPAAAPAAVPVPSALSRMVVEAAEASAQRPRPPRPQLARRGAPAPADGS